MFHDSNHKQPPHPALDTRLPGPFDDEIPPADPGSSSSRFVALLLALVLATITIIWQHLPEDTQYNALGLSPPVAVESPLVIAPIEPTSMYGRMIVKFQPLFASDPTAFDQLKRDLDKNVVTLEDRVAVATVLGEIDGPDAAIEELALIRAEIELQTPDATVDSASDQPDRGEAQLLRDIADLNTVYLAGSGSLDDLAAQRLRGRYNYFAKLALTHDLDDSDPEYAKLRGGGLAILLGLLGFGGLLVVSFLAGTVLLILGLIRYLPRSDLRQFDPPSPGGSVMLETYALFVGSFLAVAITGTVLSATKPELAIWSLAMQFSIMSLVLWPLLRGMSFARWREAMGLVAPRGLLREIGFGILAYLAAVPLFIAGTLVTFILLIVQQIMNSGAEAEPPSNDVIDLIGGASWVTIALFAVLATVWAPITEELIFRGALYRHLRARLHWVLAALFTAILFAAMHNYPVFMLTPLIVLGFMFAMMREIRGSIIASITAHFIHNATLVLVMAFVLRPLIS